METAVPQGINIHTFKKVEEEVPTPESVAQKADAEIGSLANDPRWEEMMKVIDGMIHQVQSLETVSENDSLETIGIKFMVARLVASQLRIIKNLPESIATSNNGETK